MDATTAIAAHPPPSSTLPLRCPTHCRSRDRSRARSRAAGVFAQRLPSLDSPFMLSCTSTSLA
jgi:hypothetical protein